MKKISLKSLFSTRKEQIYQFKSLEIKDFLQIRNQIAVSKSTNKKKNVLLFLEANRCGS